MPEDNKTTFECGICYMSYSNTDPEFNDVKYLDKCGHTFCKECFTETFRSLIEDQNKVHMLKCPQYGCEIKPTQEEVKQIINT